MKLGLMQDGLTKERVLQEVGFLMKNKHALLREINSNRLIIIKLFNRIEVEITKDLNDIETLIELDTDLAKINAYICMAFLNAVEDHHLDLKYITRLPNLFFKLHLNKLRILKTLTLTEKCFDSINIPGEIAWLSNLKEIDYQKIWIHS